MLPCCLPFVRSKQLISVLLFIFVSACHSKGGQSKLSPDDFESMLLKQPGILLDVRTPSEYENGHLADALNLNFLDGSFKREVSKLSPSSTFYVYCQKGGRSNDAVKLLEKKGFHHVYELDGGFQNWKENEKPIEGEIMERKVELSLADYEKITSSFPLVLIDFSAQWCGPCKKLSPLLEKIGQKRASEFKVHMIDVDENPLVTQKNEIEVLPTLLWYKNGKLVKRVSGLRSEKEINQMVDELSK